MKKHFVAISALAIAAAACGQGANGAPAAPEEAAAAAPADYAAVSGLYKPDYKHRYITFSYFHQGLSYPMIRWRSWNADLNWNAEDPAASSISVVIDATSVDSGVDEFDGHLQGERFFNTAAYPEITFTSTKVEKTGEATGKITGDLTIKGVTKPVVVDVQYNNSSHNERSGYKIGFSGKAKVKRSDFGVDFLAPGVGDDVTVVIEAEFIKQD